MGDVMCDHFHFSHIKWIVSLFIISVLATGKRVGTCL